jgi:hypothetical protein
MFGVGESEREAFELDEGLGSVEEEEMELKMRGMLLDTCRIGYHSGKESTGRERLDAESDSIARSRPIEQRTRRLHLIPLILPLLQRILSLVRKLPVCSSVLSLPLRLPFNPFQHLRLPLNLYDVRRSIHF